MLGRLAAMLAGQPRPVIVHTYHGHVLEGYFGAIQNATYRNLERGLARVSDALIGVSNATVDDLVRLGIADRSKFRMIPIGLDLTPFAESPATARDAFRRESGAAPEEVLLTYVGRIAPIKRVDVMLRAFARAWDLGAPVRLAIVGDGGLRPELERLAANLGVAERVRFVGYRADVTSVAAAADIALLTSDNEGTPVSLIEAAAAGTPAVATAVGGVRDVVTPETGVLGPPGDPERLARAIVTLAQDTETRRSLGDAARRHVTQRFSSDRLVADIDLLYGDLLAARRNRRPAPGEHDDEVDARPGSFSA
jgi:glycosyltransferase involved in cell wall biosynthesis